VTEVSLGSPQNVTITDVTMHFTLSILRSDILAVLSDVVSTHAR
jgi:hypothetical protein